MVPNSVTEEIVALTEDTLGGLALGMSGVSWRQVPQGDYVCGLVISFIRTHFILLELAIKSDLIEAATLARKQLELLARLHELTGEVDRAKVGKTPNVREIRSEVRRLYGQYSEVAHSSDPRHLELLGFAEGQPGGWKSLYPKYGRNTLVTIHNAVHIHLEFALWVSEYFPTYDLPIRDPKFGAMANRIAELMPTMIVD
jgi:hypothetical protein